MKLKSFHRYKKPTIIANKTKKIFLSLNELDIRNLLGDICCNNVPPYCMASYCTVCKTTCFTGS